MTELLIYPVSGLMVHKDLGSEFRVNQVTFISKEKLLRLRSRFGITPKVKEQIKLSLNRTDIEFGESKIYALVSVVGNSFDSGEAFKLVEKEVSILAVSQLTYSPRSHNGVISIGVKNSFKKDTHLSIDLNGKNALYSDQFIGPSSRLDLMGRWKNCARERGFFSLLNIIRGDENIAQQWMEDITNASVLIGKKSTV